jgi:hypothetical protein
VPGRKDNKDTLLLSVTCENCSCVRGKHDVIIVRTDQSVYALCIIQ